MATVPQAVIDGLNLVAGDFDTLSADETAQSAAASALASAQHVKDTADATVIADAGKLDADKAALIDLINSTFPGPTPPPPAPQKPPTPVQSGLKVA